LFKFLLFLLPLFILGCSQNITNTNTIPIANAGNFQYLDTGTTVYLDGSASSDEDGDRLTYQWSLISKPTGSGAYLVAPTSDKPSFLADLEGNYIIKLIVNDGEVDSQPAYVTISTVTFVIPSTGPQANNLIYTPASTTTQQRPMLVIRLEFANKTFINDENNWQIKLFGTQQGELNHYYHEISHNQFEFIPVSDSNDGKVVNGVTTISFLDNHPDPDIDASNFTSQLHPYLRDAIKRVYDNGNGFNFSNYDTDNGGSISPDELIITFIMAGEEDAYSGGIFDVGVWAHQWCTENTFTPDLDGLSVMSCNNNGNYAIFGERHHDSSSVSHDASIGIIAHELGHSAFDLPDLYYGTGTRIGYYGLMSNGSWGQVGNNGVPGDTPTHMTAWSKIDTGWYAQSSFSNNPNDNVPLNATGTNNYSIIKTPFYNSTDEYFLVENRGDSGYDVGLKVITPAFSGGVAIWHIDEAVIRAKRADNIINSSVSHKGVDLEEAAGDSVDYGNGDPTLNLYYSGNIDAFTPNTLPNTNLYSNARSLIFFTDISSISDTMSVRINNPAP